MAVVQSIEALEGTPPTKKVVIAKSGEIPLPEEAAAEAAAEGKQRTELTSFA